MFFYTFMPKLFNMSLTASVAIVFVILLRLLLKKAPKVISYALWGVVLFRLLCPVSIGSSFSVYNLFDAPAQESGTITSVIEYVPSNIVHTEYPSVARPVPGISDAINEGGNDSSSKNADKTKTGDTRRGASCKKSYNNDFLRRHYPHQVKGSKVDSFLSACITSSPVFGS